MTIETYDESTGKLTLTDEFPNYHYGAQLTAEDILAQSAGVDMRGEVLLLDRSIKIIGTDADEWGCQFVTTDVLISATETAKGKTILSNVEIEKGG